MKRAAICFVIFWSVVTCDAAAAWHDPDENAEYIHRSIKKVTDVIVYDIYSPPVASRTYAYICIAAYEAVIPSNTAYLSLGMQLHQLPPAPAPEKGKQYSYVVAAVNAILTVGKAMVISEQEIEAFRLQLLREFKDDGIEAELLNNSLEYGQQVADYILAWAAADNYRQTRSMAKYAVSDEAFAWKPTPPAYIKAIEPNWSKIRTFIIDSAQQFRPVPPTPFSVDKKSRFYREALAVHDTG